jgi:hypothetical protein
LTRFKRDLESDSVTFWRAEPGPLTFT